MLIVCRLEIIRYYQKYYQLLTSERVRAVEGGESESDPSVEEGGKSDSTNPAASVRHPGGSHSSSQRSIGQNISGQIKHLEK